MKKDFVTDFTGVRKLGNGLCSGFKGCNGLMLREEGSSANEQCTGFNGFNGGILREEVRIQKQIRTEEERLIPDHQFPITHYL